jgi:hypothetical protein
VELVMHKGGVVFTHAACEFVEWRGAVADTQQLDKINVMPLGA